MMYLWLWLIVLAISAAQAATITQKTEGWCSPAIGEVGGNVVVICYGKDPETVQQRRNELLDKKDHDPQAHTCQISAVISTRILSRLYARVKFSPAEQDIPFDFQELFYEWTLRLSVNTPVAALSLRIEHLTPNDRPHFDPEPMRISELQPRWFSGFSEPARKKPDYFSQTLQFEFLGANRPAVVRIRRPLNTPMLSKTELIRLGDLRGAHCRVEPWSYDVEADGDRLLYEAKRLAEWTYGSHPAQRRKRLPIKQDPGDVAPDEIQGTVEAYCQTAACDVLTINQLEAHMGKSPAEHAKEQRTNRLNQLKKDLREVLKCMKGPYDDIDSAGESKIIEMCDEAVTLYPEEMQRLFSIFEKHGVEPQVIQLKSPVGGQSKSFK
jgi:hypothetical protein